MFYLHLKETEFRFNHRRDNLCKLMMKMLREQPIQTLDSPRPKLKFPNSQHHHRSKPTVSVQQAAIGFLARLDITSIGIRPTAIEGPQHRDARHDIPITFPVVVHIQCEGQNIVSFAPTADRLATTSQQFADSINIPAQSTFARPSQLGGYIIEPPPSELPKPNFNPDHAQSNSVTNQHILNTGPANARMRIWLNSRM